MRYLTPLSALALMTTLSLADAAPGYRTDVLPVDHRIADLDLHIWYPADGDVDMSTIGKNAVFRGTDVRLRAAMPQTPLPLLVLSHGSGGNAANLGWIAGHLAERGMLVIAPNHPGTTSRDSHPDQTVQIWDRPADLSAVIDHALDTYPIARIGVLGFSLGGHTALGLAGAQVRKADYITYCDAHSGMMDCGWLSDGGVDFAQIDQQRYEQSLHDPRVTVAVSIDPALSQAYDHPSLARIDSAVQLISLGGERDIPAAVQASNLIGSLSDARLHHVEGATHFSFLGECTRMGKVIIMAAGDDPICSDAGTRDRADIHAELQGVIGDFLEEHLID